jgi:hypothetical protein
MDCATCLFNGCLWLSGLTLIIATDDGVFRATVPALLDSTENPGDKVRYL